MFKLLFKSMIGSLLMMCAIGVTAAVAYTVDADGRILQAENVDVGGILYSVTFAGGFCSNAHGSCDDSAFAFANDPAGAEAASQALIDQVLLDNVLVDGITYNFDANTGTAVGCGLITNGCWIYTAFSAIGFGTADAMVIGNWNGVPTPIQQIAHDLLGTNSVWAVWSVQQPSPVPVPAAVWMLGSALLGLAGARRKRT